MRVYENLVRAAQERPDHPALEFFGASIRYGELDEAARRVAAGLVAQGIRPGDSVGLMLPNLPEFVASYFGALMAGTIVVPMNVLLRAPEIEYLINDSNIRLIITFEMFADQVVEAVRRVRKPPKVFVVYNSKGGFPSYADLPVAVDAFRPVERDPHLPIMTIYTSGTTGKPKGAQITNLNVAANLDMIEGVVPTEPDDKQLCVLPLFHVFALVGVLNSTIRAATTVVLHPKFEPDQAVQSILQDGITTFAGVPTMYFYMLKHPNIGALRGSRLRTCFTGGAAMPVEVLHQFEQVTGATVYEGFGLTETTVSVCLNRRDRRKIGSIGIPFDGVEMKIVDDDGNELPDGEIGEVVIRSPNVMIGYLNKPEETAEAMKGGWFHSGDLGKRDEDGFFYILDRKKDMIIKGGFNIYPREIEEVIYQLPEVAEAAVIGVFDEAKGEAVRACIACKPGKSLTEEEVHAYLVENLAKYKLPQQYVFLPELPKGPTGKILKRELRQTTEQWNKDRLAPTAVS